MTRVVRTLSAWSVWTAECDRVGCLWDATSSMVGAASVEDAARDHTAQTGHTVAVERTLRYNFQVDAMSGRR